MSQYKLIYFNLRARGEVIRLLFAAAGQKYEDVRIEFPRTKQWEELKPKTPFGQLPVLEVREQNKVIALSQSIAITRYLARKFGMAGKNDLETTEIDVYGDQITDLQNSIISWLAEPDKDRRKELQKKLFDQTVPHNLKLFDDRLGRTGSGLFVPSGLSWADLHCFNVLEYFGKRKDETIGNFKNLTALDKRIRAEPKIATWLKQRPQTN